MPAPIASGAMPQVWRTTSNRRSSPKKASRLASVRLIARSAPRPRMSAATTRTSFARVVKSPSGSLIVCREAYRSHDSSYVNTSCHAPGGRGESA